MLSFIIGTVLIGFFCLTDSIEKKHRDKQREAMFAYPYDHVAMESESIRRRLDRQREARFAYPYDHSEYEDKAKTFTKKSPNHELGVNVIGVPQCDSKLSEAGILNDLDTTANQTDIDRRIAEIKNLLQREDFNDEIRSFLFGALGEHKTLKALLNLEGNYCIINDVNIEFDRPYLDHDVNEWVCNAQIDHVVVGTTGIFAIESKYWSTETVSKMKNDELYSPLAQAQRNSKALWKFIEEECDTEYSLPVQAVIALCGSGSIRGNWRVRAIPVEKLSHFISRYNRKSSYLTINEIRDVVECVESLMQ